MYVPPHTYTPPSTNITPMTPSAGAAYALSMESLAAANPSLNSGQYYGAIYQDVYQHVLSSASGNTAVAAQFTSDFNAGIYTAGISNATALQGFCDAVRWEQNNQGAIQGVLDQFQQLNANSPSNPSPSTVTADTVLTMESDELLNPYAVARDYADGLDAYYKAQSAARPVGTLAPAWDDVATGFMNGLNAAPKDIQFNALQEQDLTSRVDNYNASMSAAGGAQGASVIQNGATAIASLNPYAGIGLMSLSLAGFWNQKYQDLGMPAWLANTLIPAGYVFNTYGPVATSTLAGAVATSYPSLSWSDTSSDNSATS